MTEWTAAAADLRRRNLAEGKPTLSVVHDAIRSIRAMAKRGIEDFGIGLTKPSAEMLARAEADLFIGVTMPVSDDDAPDGHVEKPDLLSGAIEGTGPLSPSWLADRGIETSPASPLKPSRDVAPRPHAPSRDPAPDAATNSEPQAAPERPDDEDDDLAWSVKYD